MSNREKLPKLSERTLRRYFSDRQKKSMSGDVISLEEFRRRLAMLYRDFSTCGYFSEAFGTICIDGDYGGTVGDVSYYFEKILGRPGLYPIEEKIETLSRDEIFDLVEILYDHCSKPIDGTFHSYNGCGWHFEKFALEDGRSDFANKLNPLLILIDEGYRLERSGDIVFLGTAHLSQIFEASVPSKDHDGVVARVDSAIAAFKSRQANLSERRQAVRSLVDVLEYIRPSLEKVLTKKDENDLFNIANNFGIRHHNQRQQTQYDEAIWLSWMFYFYLSTIHASLRLIEKAEAQV